MVKHRRFAKASFVVDSPGLLTTVQDEGRKGFQQYGMPVAGPMDRESYLLGQALVGNKEKLGALECTLLPPSLSLRGATIVAFTGANMNPRINGISVPMYIPFLCHDGDLISGSLASEGMRMYISFAGGIDVPAVNGSVATYTKACIGGYHGRALRQGDHVELKEFERDSISWCSFDYRSHRLRNAELSAPGSQELKDLFGIVLGSQARCFTETGLETFVRGAYKLTDRCDRMGFRLDGPTIEHVGEADIISDGTVFGSVQVPKDGQPIILMADRQTTGGYTKIGTVITPDLPRLSQVSVGETLRFEILSIEEAQTRYKTYLSDWEERLQIARDQSRYVFNLRRNE